MFDSETAVVASLHPWDNRLMTGKVYCATVLDVFSRAIVGWAIADHMRSELVVDALQIARPVHVIEVFSCAQQTGG